MSPFVYCLLALLSERLADGLRVPLLAVLQH